ncbi:MAG TPA: type VII secretion protein EccB [Mycobacterium sp.]|nr:type VII secretion protein EccB [Mycobacterium sp.]
MAGRYTAQLQASGHRFVLRRVECALLCGTVRSPDEPLRVRSSLAVGCLLAALVVGGCALLAVVRPQSVPDSAPIVLGRQSGALYVWVDATLHPVLNVASARLIAATDADPQPVRESDLERTPRGPLLGIPGAPQAVGAALPETATWSVCDTAGDAGPTTTVVAAAGRPLPGTPIDPEQPTAVTLGGDAAPQLLYRGRRTVAVRPVGPAPRVVSGLLLNAIPEAPPTGQVADFSGGAAALPAGSSTLCATWTWLPDGGADVTLSAGDGLPLPAGAAPVALAQADGAGPALDAVYLPPGRSGYVRSAGLAPRAGGERYLVVETGVRFPIGDDEAGHSLGLPATAAPAPWPVLAALPTGPQLSRQYALVPRP